MKSIQVIALVLCIFVAVATAESLFVVDHYSNLYAFRIDYENSKLIFMKKISLPLHENSYGAVDLAIDRESGALFISSENTNVLQVVDAKTMTLKFEQEFDEFNNLTGIVYDSPRNRLLGTVRDTNKLCIFDWNSSLERLPKHPDVVELYDVTYACGVDLDGDNLYVSKLNYSTSGLYRNVYVYDATNLPEDPNTITTIDMDNYTVGIACHTGNKVLYGGAYGWFYPYVVKYDLASDTIISKPVDGDFTTGLTCDNGVSGSLYTTSKDAGIRMWDTSDWADDPNQTVSPFFTYDNSNNDGVVLGGLAGCVVGDTVKTKGLILLSVENDVLETDVVSPMAGDKNQINYSITVDPNGLDHQDVVVYAYLPQGLSPTPDMVLQTLGTDIPYTSTMQAADYAWHLPDILTADSPVELELETFVNDYAEPGGTLEPYFVVECREHYDEASDSVDVSCWAGETIYVDCHAEAPGSGASWETAYTNLQDALDRASGSCGKMILVADGFYTPGADAADTFELAQDVSIEGGYNGYDFTGQYSDLNIPYAPDHRDIRLNRTILSGQNLNQYVVTMKDYSSIDGCYIISAVEDGVVSDSSGEAFVENCYIGDCAENGIYFILEDCLVKSSEIKNCGQNGIYVTASGNAEISGIIATGNGRNGVYAQNCKVNIKNSIVSNNGSGTDYVGVNLKDVSALSQLESCTISANKNAGIRVTSGSLPTIMNSIIWKNGQYATSGYEYTDLSGFEPNSCSYCCLTNNSNPDAINVATDLYNNIYSNPKFLYESIGMVNFHLSADSPCLDLGSSTLETLDIDNEIRTNGTSVDIGADELYNSNLTHICDFNGNGNANYADFGLLSYSFGYGIGDPNYVLRCDVDAVNSPNKVDEYDLLEFADNWLWEANWFSSRHATDQPVEVMQTFMTLMPLSLFSVPELTAQEKLAIVEEAGELKETQYLLNELPEFDGKGDAAKLLDDCLETLENQYNPYGD